MVTFDHFEAKKVRFLKKFNCKNSSLEFFLTNAEIDTINYIWLKQKLFISIQFREHSLEVILS